ncbi:MULTISPECIES: GNAT family N-acetyltransferase [unclassified Brevibacterium]|uniref:GNAT family N-acetyltransferase n=1 Tax=unclassified Brevibacterium TaxID=2614124 RepID=UPI000C7612BC|nr:MULTISPECIES: GNAT family N-acetyltransferase [unclassified Brevibacterium]
MTQSRWSAVRDNQVPDDVDRLLLSVPEWFGRPESNAEYVDDARTMETWTVRSDVGEVVGVGTAMMRAVAADVRARGAQLLQVKTLGASSPDPNYDRTRHFYERMGFIPLEETDLWDEATPCLIMVMPLV